MRTALITIGLAVLVLGFAGMAQADTVWDSGYHQILDGETYGEIWMYNDAAADMLGGDVLQLGALDSSRFNMFEGTMNTLMVRYNSVANIYGGSINDVGLAEDALVNLYAYDVVYHYNEEYNGWMEGNYISNDQHFAFGFATYDTSHINVVPEPSTLILLGISGLLLRKKR